ncbi:phage/plasmid primase, P4 family [Streptomyces fagopyri]|uniref:DNA primase family protein n=1 Tax=Streptomyces fagopyri TaxID=2662397 RepID=UPI0037107DE9
MTTSFDSTRFCAHPTSDGRLCDMTEPTHHDGQLGHDFRAPDTDGPLWLDDEPAVPKPRRRPVPVSTTHRGQLRMAERFVAEHADALRFVHGISWHGWDGARWLADEERADMQAAVATVKAALASLADLDKTERDDLYQDARKSESAAGLEGMLRIASALPPISTASKRLDSDPYLFNTPQGTLDLRNGEVLDNDREHLITKVAGGRVGGRPYDEWENFLKRILPDEDVRAFVQRLFGYAMLGKVTEHVMPIFTGSGANGKGTIRDAVMAAFGDYAIEIDPAMLMESKHERHGAFKMRLRGARLAFCSETEKGRKFAEATMKRLVGGDQIEANLMHRNPITFDPSHTLIMLTNHLPAVSGDDPAVWRRILVVPFDVVIPPEERDGELPERLKGASDAVLAWLYEGWLSYQDQGLNPPEAVRARTEAYQADSDALGRFLAERTIANPNDAVKARELFTEWSAWCHASGMKAEDVGTEVTFAASMQSRGFEKKRSASGMRYQGLMLAGTNEPDEERF